MRVTVVIEKEVSVSADDTWISSIVEKSLERSQHAYTLRAKQVSVHVTYVSSDVIKQINATYRDKEAVTDIISIGEYSDERDVAQEESVEVMLGELFLCWDVIEASAPVHKVSLMYEHAYILSHGILHLLGYAHSEEMFGIQEDIADFYDHS